jgi:RNA polymerase sigma-70 factor (ECF subfamily)
MDGAEGTTPQTIERYRNYLKLLARMQLHVRLRSKLDSSDIVQETLVKACQNLAQYHGHTDAELAAWLRRILANHLIDEARKYQRELSLGHSVLHELDDSSARLEAWLAAEQSCPSQCAERQEQLLHLANALAQLPDDQRVVIELHYLNRLTVAKVAQEMQRTEPAVAGLLRRGMQKLRDLLAKPS